MNQELVHELLRCIHIFTGGLAVLTGLLSIILKKGHHWHNLMGLIYYYAMFVVFITVLPLTYLNPNFFLLVVGIFSFYMAFTGYRFTRLKPGKTPSKLDQLATWIGALSALGMIGLGTLSLITVGGATGIILDVFGAILLLMTLSDLRRIYSKKETPKLGWLFGHLGRMVGSYIAAITALLVNNVTIGTPILLWLGPTVVGTIFIIFSIRYFKKKYSV